MTDREVEALSDFLQHFGVFKCRQTSVRRADPKPRSEEELGRLVLATLARWRAEGLDAERLYKLATIIVHFDAPTSCPGPAACRRAAGRGARWRRPARPGRVGR